MKVVFLSQDEVLALHADQIERYGGSHGIRDTGLLNSALAMPRATFGGQWLHGSLHEMAAAYVYHLVHGHAFIDGNKRAGLMAMLAFLGLNSLRLDATEDELVEIVLGVAGGSARPRWRCSSSGTLAVNGGRAAWTLRQAVTPRPFSPRHRPAPHG